ncbi:hypothetical protein FOZ60_007785 [Perkinsus olseni]|uniref:Uncharacterized protein n=1 Tax=Perkinsus olseni TaxID=32597 RepID=A0A7J6PGM7_PEROL|nr:hypothetical protein FOZ60_007785 [Perkinsus olseni]
MLSHVLLVVFTIFRSATSQSREGKSGAIRKLRTAVVNINNQLNDVVEALSELLGENPPSNDLPEGVASEEGVVVDPEWLKKAIDVMYGGRDPTAHSEGYAKDTPTHREGYAEDTIAHRERFSFSSLRLKDFREQVLSLFTVDEDTAAWLWGCAVWLLMLVIDIGLCTVLMIYAKGGSIDVRDTVSMQDWILSQLSMSCLLALSLRLLSLFVAPEDSLAAHLMDAALLTLRVLGVVTMLVNQGDARGKQEKLSAPVRSSSHARSATPTRYHRRQGTVRTPEFRSPIVEGCRPRVGSS